MQHVHFIAIGSVLLDLAVAVSKKNGYKVTVSGENFPESNLNRLRQYDIAPDRQGWFPDQITRSISAVVYGSEADNDNPELMRARELGLKIYSAPEYLFVQTRNKTRIVVAGSHGKTTITAMILYVMKKLRMDADYLIGGELEGFETKVRLSFESRIAVFDGDENLSSTIDKRPRFHQYKPHIAILTGIDQGNNPDFTGSGSYLEQFEQFINLVETQGRLIFFDGDPALRELTSHLRRDLVAFPYNTPGFVLEDGTYFIKTRKGKRQVNIKKEKLLSCVQAAMLACRQVGINEDQFFSVIGGFTTDMLKQQEE